MVTTADQKAETTHDHDHECLQQAVRLLQIVTPLYETQRNVFAEPFQRTIRGLHLMLSIARDRINASSYVRDFFEVLLKIRDWRSFAWVKELDDIFQVLRMITIEPGILQEFFDLLPREHVISKSFFRFLDEIWTAGGQSVKASEICLFINKLYQCLSMLSGEAAVLLSKLFVKLRCDVDEKKAYDELRSMVAKDLHRIPFRVWKSFYLRRLAANLEPGKLLQIDPEIVLVNPALMLLKSIGFEPIKCPSFVQAINRLWKNKDLKGFLVRSVLPWLFGWFKISAKSTFL